MLWCVLLAAVVVPSAIAGPAVEKLPDRFEAPARVTAPRKVPDILYTPAQGIDQAYDDMLALVRAGKNPRHYRWLSSYNGTSQARLDLWHALASFVAGSLNFVSVNIGPLAKVDAAGRLLRIDLDFLGIDP